VGDLPRETPELQIEAARGLMTEGRYDVALEETGKFIRWYGDTDLADENRFLRGEIKMAKGDYIGAAREFQQVVTNHPDSDLVDEVIAKQYEIGDLFYEKGVEEGDPWWNLFSAGPFKKAIEVYGMVIGNQPFSEEAAEAQYKVGLCHFAKDDYLDAALEFRRVTEYYGDTDWVDDASYSLAECYAEASLDPPYDQVPSMLAIRSIDTFQSRFPADPRADELDDERRAMREKIATNRLRTAGFYEKRREFRAARIYYEVVSARFPETEAGAAAREWLENNPDVGVNTALPLPEPGVPVG
jgi:outer membrane protein assembly factor BamD